MRYILLFFLLITSLSADELMQEENASVPSLEVQGQILTYSKSIDNINKNLKGNIWLTRFSNFLTYQRLLKKLDKLDNELKKLERVRKNRDIKKIKELEVKQKTLEKQIELLTEYKNSPFSELIKPIEIDEAPKINNPIAIISGFSYIKQLQSQKKEYEDRLAGLDDIINKLNSKKDMLKWIVLKSTNGDYLESLNVVNQELSELQAAKDVLQTTFTVYSKKIDEAVITTTDDIKEQVKRAFNIAIFLVVVIVLSLIFRYFARRYIKDNVRYYMANKVINFINVTLIVLILLFSYIDNVTYLVTVVGFASAGIAIAMKDMFMSVLGWMVIVFGGSFHVGDRIKVRKEGLSYVGDIIDISLLRMTILEDVTLTTYSENRRSGRIVFIPNNYIFTDLIANYTHFSMKTVWDGIDFTVTFDSNHKKAMYIIKNITRKYSKGYTDIARKHLNQLRNQYSLQNTNVEPRIFSFLEPHGVTISVWYMTNSYATLTMRSTISSDIIQAINKEEDISIAFPTQTLHLNPKTRPNLPEIDNEKSLF